MIGGESVDRRYLRQYENYDTIIPKSEDFPTINQDGSTVRKVASDINSSNLENFHIDDIVLIGILILLLSEDQKDITAILGIAFLFLAEYIF